MVWSFSLSSVFSWEEPLLYSTLAAPAFLRLAQLRAGRTFCKGQAHPVTELILTWVIHSSNNRTKIQCQVLSI